MLENNLSSPPETTSPAESMSWLDRPIWLSLALDWEKAIYITILVVAILSRFWGLGDRVVSHDESLHTQYSFQYYNGDGYTHTPLMHGPFLFHATALSYWLFGHNDLTARIPVALFGVFLVIMPIYLRDWIGRRGAIFASIVLLVSPYVTYYSRYIRHDVYVIVWAMIVFIATWHYIKYRKEVSLWWFAGGLALTYATKEVSFIYTAIFGSFLVIRLGALILRDGWLFKRLGAAMWPLIMVGLSILVLGVGLVGSELATRAAEEMEVATQVVPQAVDPEAELQTQSLASNERVYSILQIVGFAILTAGLIMLIVNWRDDLDPYPEFDLIVLYATLLLPMMTALFVQLSGGDPLDYNAVTCVLPGQESMGAAQLIFARLTNFSCYTTFFSAGIGYTSLFLVPLIGIGAAVGLWWNQRKWLAAAAVFHVAFALLYTSFFTNPGGWITGSVGSLGYWLDQQEVQRGSQPVYYYALVVPLYEFLPILFSLFAIRWWVKMKQILPIYRFWAWTVVIGLIAYSFSNWYFNLGSGLIGEEPTRLPGFFVMLGIFGAAAAIWILYVSGQGLKETGLQSWRQAMTIDDWVDFFPSLVWWLVLTAAAYTVAGEKMPWLSIHFVIPMSLMIGWYAQHRLSETDVRTLITPRFWALTGLMAVFLVALFLAVGPAILGRVQFGALSASGQYHLGRFVGGFLLAGGILYGIFYLAQDEDERVLPVSLVSAVFVLLTVLTVRFTYMANFPNGDYATEYLVYAHGAPGTKDEVMTQLETLSFRAYGDMRLNVHYDNETSWPYTWYLRNFTDRRFFGANPSPDIRNADVVLVGDTNYSKVEPYLSDEFDYQEFTYLWWPMEDYRQITWSTVLGSEATGWMGLRDPAVRVAMWDIFFYRDYSKYGEVTNKNFNVGSWPLRRTMRIYVSRDLKAELWDRGIGATEIVSPADPYEAGEIAFAPTQIIGQGELARPRNIAIAPDDVIYVADSGNHRIVAIDPAGNTILSFGQFGAEPGQFNEPWGLAVDDEFVYVADTWNHRVQKFTREGEYVSTIGASGTVEDASTGGGLFFGPRDIILLPENKLLITDTGNHRIQVFDRDGAVLSVFGRLGALSGEFYEPVGLATSPDGAIFVADTWNERIQELTGQEPLFAINEIEVDAWDTSQSTENKPYMATDSLGRLYVTDPEGYRVLVFDRAGGYVGRFGTFAPDSSGFGLPNGIAVDSQDQVYVVDSANGAVLKFAPLP